jgi:hypothetical protein
LYLKWVPKYFRSWNASFKIIHFSCETFPNKVIQNKFSSLNIHSKKSLQWFIKSLPNWNKSPSCHRAIPFSSDSWGIIWSFLLPVYLIPSLPPAHLRWAANLILKVKITATTLYSEGDYFPAIPSINGPIMVIISSSSWLQFQLTQAWEYITIIQHFMVTNHPIMSAISPPSNAIKQRIKLPT